MGGRLTSDDAADTLAYALSGDQEAMLSLAKAWLPAIQVRVARSLAARSGRFEARDVEDLTQEVFVRLFARDARVLRSFDPHRGTSLLGFIRLVADREVSNVLRSDRRRPSARNLVLDDQLDETSEPAVQEQRAIRRDLMAKLYHRLQAWLTPRGRELFDVVFVEDQPIETVAERFGMKRGAIYAWKNRVCVKARSLVEELEGAEDTGRSQARMR
ncbi:MAG: sigma-70 family RNA polymerase sigma factor [Myxococcota bacterium]